MNFENMQVFKKITELTLKKGRTCPLYTYKSINKDTIKTLTEGYLYFSHPRDFNDPFDCHHNLIIDDHSVEEYDLFFKKFNLTNNTSLNLDYSNNSLKEDLKKFLINEINKKLDQIGICCFSREKENILMWSHYADKHQGICLEFDGKPFENLPLDISYTKDFAIRKYIATDPAEQLDSLYHLFYTKSDKWEYEQEMRSFKYNINTDEERKIRFDKNTLKAIYFGISCKSENIQLIKETILNSNYPSNIKFYKAQYIKNEFGIRFNEI